VVQEADLDQIADAGAERRARDRLPFRERRIAAARREQVPAGEIPDVLLRASRIVDRAPQRAFAARQLEFGAEPAVGVSRNLGNRDQVLPGLTIPRRRCGRGLLCRRLAGEHRRHGGSQAQQNHDGCEETKRQRADAWMPFHSFSYLTSVSVGGFGSGGGVGAGFTWMTPVSSGWSEQT
jgi:hypothetical protein